MKFDICILYDGDLPNGLKSCARGEGRTLQNFAECWSEAGHRVDIYSNSFIKDTSSVYFGLLDGIQDKIYDTCVFGGWGNIIKLVVDKVKAKRYIYIDYSRSWRQQPWQHDILRRDDFFVSCARSSYIPLFLENNPYTDKFIYIPQPICREFIDNNGYDNNQWAFTYKWLPGEHIPDRWRRLNECIEWVKNEAVARDVQIVDFPTNKSLDEAYSHLIPLQMSFPMRAAGSSVESVICGVATLPVFPDHKKEIATLASTFLKHNMLMVHPLEVDHFEDSVRRVLDDKMLYSKLISDCRDVLSEYIFLNAEQTFQNNITKIL